MRSKLRTLGAVAVAVVLLPQPLAGVAWGAEASGSGKPCPHCHPEAGQASSAAKLRRATRSTAEVAVPPIALVRDDGQATTLAEVLEDGRPVVVDFVFTTCATICPVLSQTFARLQEQLGPDAARVRLVSISIDPEHDTPERLAAYARRFGARPGWHFYTGTAEASVAAQRAFEAYRGEKMNHTPIVFLRAASGGRWVRLDGFPSADELARELRGLVAAR